MDVLDQRRGLLHYQRILLVAVVLVAGILLGWLVVDSFTCTSTRKSIVLEIPRYGGGQLRHVGSGDGGECMATYTAVTNSADVLMYYEEQLPHHAWVIVRRSGPHDVPRGLEAARDNFHYSVAVIDEGLEEVTVAVYVSQ